MLKRYSGTIGIIMALSLAGSAFAADFKVGDVNLKLGGSIRADMGYQFTDKGDVAPGLKDSKTDFFLEEPGNSRIYVGADYQKVGGYIEIATKNGDGAVNTRHAYMTYSPTDKDSFLIGKTWSLLSEIGPDGQRLKGDGNLGGYGDLTESRNTQIRYTRKFDDKLSMSVAIEDNITSTTDVNTEDAPFQIKSTIPTVLVSVTANPTDKISLTPSFMFQRYTLDRNAESGVDYAYTDHYGVVHNNLRSKSLNVQSWAAALNASIALDAVTVSAEIWGGENVTDYTEADNMDPRGEDTVFGAAFVDQRKLANGQFDLNDTPSFGGWLQLSVPVNKMTLLAGAGYQQARPEGPSATVADEVHTWGAFADLVIPVKGGFYVEPEIAYLDRGQATFRGTNGKFDDLGHDVLVGVHFQYDF